LLKKNIFLNHNDIFLPVVYGSNSRTSTVKLLNIIIITILLLILLLP